MNRKFVALGAVVFLGQSALAQDKENVIREADRVVYRKKQVIDFTDVAIDGELVKPEGSYAVSKNKTRFRSLVKVREHFVSELQKSVDNL